jgi:membrane protein required for colicin V production
MSDMPITAVDVIVLLVLLISAVAAFARGFVHEVLSIGAWIGAGIATIYLFPMAQPHARELVAIPLLADIGAGIVIFLACLIVLAVLTRTLSSRVKDSALGALDRSLGLVFGVLRGAVIVALAWLVMVWALPEESDRPDWIQEAKSRRLVEASADALAQVLPGDLGTEARAASDTQAPAEPGPSEVERWSKPEPEAETPPEKQGYDESERQRMKSLSESITSGAEDGNSEGTSGQ